MRLCELKPEAHKSAIPASHKNQRPAFTTRKIECASKSLRLTIAKTAAQITKGPSNQTRTRTTFEEFICVVLMIRPTSADPGVSSATLPLPKLVQPYCRLWSAQTLALSGAFLPFEPKMLGKEFSRLSLTLFAQYNRFGFAFRI